mgnify:CR=1 FL=1
MMFTKEDFAKSILNGPLLEKVMVGISRKILLKSQSEKRSFCYALSPHGFAFLIDTNTFDAVETFRFSELLAEQADGIPAALKFTAKLAGVKLDAVAMELHAADFLKIIFAEAGPYNAVFAFPAIEKNKPAAAIFRRGWFLPGQKMRVGPFLKINI